MSIAGSMRLEKLPNITEPGESEPIESIRHDATCITSSTPFW
jgi:hypothetical protein